ncbi:glutathione S-transferase family protein [Sphingobium terrigena]|uniref:glutathione transferase n=1 Tax=Sphingobium terrigena TaxID=2304063 RepID=A0A418YY94_9SPHN|nr:glutathione S-transferase family protein [Sphingobium terrigena]RJG57848.1 glutathione S-transferase family protein [Sphingobium terrigena]
MLTVHHLGISQSDRIVWLCEELSIPYELVRYERDPVTRLAPEAYKALHPSGTAPVITDEGLTLAESGAIIDYIVARHGGRKLTLQAEHPDFAQFLYWYHFANGSLMPCMMMLMGAGGLTGIMRDRLARNLAALEAHFTQGHRWLAGDAFTIADIMIMFPLTTMRAFVPVDLSPYPNLRAYLHRVADRPAFRSAMAKADPDRKLQID